MCLILCKSHLENLVNRWNRSDLVEISYWSQLAIGGRIHTRTHIYTLSLFLLFVYFFVCVLSLAAKGLVIIRFRWTTVDQDYNNKQQVENRP